jgi:hypothetical protein
MIPMVGFFKSAGETAPILRVRIQGPVHEWNPPRPRVTDHGAGMKRVLSALGHESTGLRFGEKKDEPFQVID